jgi:hypothetical protein
MDELASQLYVVPMELATMLITPPSDALPVLLMTATNKRADLIAAIEGISPQYVEQRHVLLVLCVVVLLLLKYVVQRHVTWPFRVAPYT